MGNNSSSNNTHKEAKIAAQKFDTDEIHVLRKTWQDLSDRSDGSGIDKETFLQYFPLNGLLGERLFAQFDNKKTGSIDFDDFILGLATVCRYGSLAALILSVTKLFFFLTCWTVEVELISSLLFITPVLSYSQRFHGRQDPLRV